MSCIVGVKDVYGDVWIGGDSAWVQGDSIGRVTEPKVFRKFFPDDDVKTSNSMVLGSAGSLRVLNLAAYELHLPLPSGPPS